MKYQLRAPQAQVLKSSARFRVLVAGRRFGKTFLACILLVLAGVAVPGRFCMYVFPTYRQAKMIAWKPLKELARSRAVSINETDLSIELKNGSVICLRGTDKPDSLRGVGLDLVILDEYADMKPEAWVEVLRPATADKKGRALFIGTPKGWNHFKDLYDYAMESGDPDWQAWQFTTEQGGNVSPEEIEAARRTMDERTFRQEFMATFESMAGRVFYNFARAMHPTGNVAADLADNGGPILVGMDFNVDPMTAVIGVRAGDQLHLLDEVVIRQSNTYEMAQALTARVAEMEKAWAASHESRGPRQVIVHPDPSGNSRRTSSPVGETDFTILREAGFKVEAFAAAAPVVDGINAVNALLKNVNGDRRLLVHPRCKSVIKALDGLGFKDGTNLPDKESGLDHAADALRYLVEQEFPMIRNTLKRRPLRI